MVLRKIAGAGSSPGHHTSLTHDFLLASSGFQVCDPGQLCLMFVTDLVYMRGGRAPQNTVGVSDLEPQVLDRLEKSQPCSHSGVRIFPSQVFYSEVGVDKSLQEQSHTVPLSQDTAATVSISILLAPQSTPVVGISAIFRRVSNLGCVRCCICNDNN